jgi:hypothetical protein
MVGALAAEAPVVFVILRLLIVPEVLQELSPRECVINKKVSVPVRTRAELFSVVPVMAEQEPAGEEVVLKSKFCLTVCSKHFMD